MHGTRLLQQRAPAAACLGVGVSVSVASRPGEAASGMHDAHMPAKALTAA